MATWPSANKPATTTTDAASDSISGARADINKALTNQIEIIDMFNIPGSPTDNYILKYNASTGVFDMEADSGGTITSVTNFVDNRVVTASGATTLNGEANLTFDGSTLTLASSTIAMGTGKITGLGDPTAAQDAATKAYVDVFRAVETFTNGSNNRILTATGPTGINGESLFTFDGSNAQLVGTALSITQPILSIETLNSGWNRPLLMLNDSNGNVASIGGQHNTSADLYTYNFTLDPANTNGRTGVTTFAGDYFVGFTKNYSTASAISMDMNVYGANAGFNISAFDDWNNGGGNQYGRKPIRLKGSEVDLQVGGNSILKVDSDSVDITQNVVITDTEQLKFGTTTTIDKDEITTTGGMTVNVDSDNSSNEAFIIQSAGTDVMKFERGPGGDAEMTVSGDGFFIKDDADKTNFSMDLSNASATGINVIRSNENKTLSFTLKTDDDDDTGNYDGAWSFRQNADEKALILERADGSAVEIFEVRDSANVATADPIDIFEFKIPPVVPSYAVGSLPTTVIAGAQALATGCNSSDVSTGTAMAFFDGSNWKYTHLPATTVRT